MLKRNLSAFSKPIWETVKYRYLLFKLKVEADEILIVSDTGIGDLYVKLILFKALGERFGTNKISIGIFKASHLDVVKLFKEDIYKSYRLSFSEVSLIKLFSKQPQKGKATHPFYVNLALFRSIGYKGVHFLDVVKFLMNLKLDSGISLPIPSTEACTKSACTISKNKLIPNKTVVISPHAVYFKDIDCSFWLCLAKQLHARGFSVVLMTEKITSEIPEIQNVFFSLEEAIPFINSCGYFIGYRSGFCDLISSSTAKMVIVYPPTEEYSTLNFDVFKGFSLQEMGLNEGSSLLEISLSPQEDFSCPHKKIIDFINE